MDLNMGAGDDAEEMDGENMGEGFFPGFQFDLDGLIGEIEKRGWKRVIFQVPDGLKKETVRLLVHISKKIGDGVKTIFALSTSPAFGACDVISPPAGFDGVVHMGHAPMPGIGGSGGTIFVEMRRVVPEELAGTERLIFALGEIGASRVGLTATVQYLDFLRPVKEILSEHGFEAVVGDSGGRAVHPGQVLGCSFHPALVVRDVVDVFVFVGDGVFHPVGVSISTGKRVLRYDPLSGFCEYVNAEDFVKKRMLAVARASDARRWGVLVSTKPGQHRPSIAFNVYNLLVENGMEAIVFVGDTFSPEMFLGLDVEAFVSTACPRIAYDDAALYKRPVLTPQELEILVGKRTWDDYSPDFF